MGFKLIIWTLLPLWTPSDSLHNEVKEKWNVPCWARRATSVMVDAPQHLQMLRQPGGELAIAAQSIALNWIWPFEKKQY